MISIHITPDTILTGVTDMAGEIVSYVREEVGEDRSLGSILQRIAASIRSIVAERSVTGTRPIAIVLSLPGPADASQGLSTYSPHYPTGAVTSRCADAVTHSRRADAPLHLDCVNRYQAVAEQVRRVATGATNFIIIDALDEGLGSGIVLHGTLLQGSQSLSGEIGTLPWTPCTATPASAATAAASRQWCPPRGSARWPRPPAPGESSALFESASPHELMLEAICEAASRGDRLATSLIDDVARWFLVGIGNIVMVNDPELIVIQGRYVRAGDCFLRRLREGISRIGLPDVEKKVRIEYSPLGEDRGVLGGAAFVLEQVSRANPSSDLGPAAITGGRSQGAEGARRRRGGSAVKQAVMTSPGHIEFHDVAVPVPAAGQVLLRMKRIGVCGSDIHVWHGKHALTPYPVVQGHEVSGIVEKVGPGVR